MTKAEDKKKTTSTSTTAAKRGKVSAQAAASTKSASHAAKAVRKKNSPANPAKVSRAKTPARATKVSASSAKTPAKSASTATSAKKQVAKRKASPSSTADWKRSVKRSTFSGKPDMVSRSIRMYPDQEVELRKRAAESDRSLNGLINLMVAWYFSRFEDEDALQPRGDHRPADMVIYKQTSFQFRTRKETMDRLEAFKPAFGKALSPVISAIIDEYLRDQQGRPAPADKTEE